MIIKSTRSDGGWVPWSLLVAWLAALVLVVPAGAQEFSLTRCLVAGGQGGQIDMSRYFACYEAQRQYEVSRYKEAAERERQRRATEEATRQQEAEAQAQAQAQEAADRAAKARQEAERARQAEAVERARKAEEVERARRAEAVERTRKAAEEVDAARRTEALQEAQRRRAAEQFMPGMCPLGDLTAKCAMSSPDPVVEQIRRSQENAARGRPNR